ncbi:MAG: RNA polymerase sigma factor [Actinomycetota bacterium]|nr:RNA polymerase sigma factor [Actinomycetota bacterium]
MTDADPHRSIEAVWRLESTRLIAALVRMVRDVGLAEDLAQEALVAALSQWPESGVPKNPGAWLMAVAKRRAVDTFRRREREDRAYGELGEKLEDAVRGVEAAVDHVEDDVLRLMFICCHPALTVDAQVTLTLRLLAGLTTKEIARSFLTTESTIGQRVSRAKKVLAEVGAPMEEPAEDERAARMAAVMTVTYLLFNEGYSATAGDDWMGPALCEEALRLGRILAALAPRESEAHGLVALMELQFSRSASRVGTDGDPILLLEQDRSRWDRLLIRRGLAALEKAESLDEAPGPYALQAAIAACHARARTGDETDWVRIAALYESLAVIAGSAVVELNRAVAVSMAYGPARGLRLLDQIADAPQLRTYHLLPSVRGDLLVKLGRLDEARAEFERAATLTQNERERALLLGRAAGC